MDSLNRRQFIKIAAGAGAYGLLGALSPDIANVMGSESKALAIEGAVPKLLMTDLLRLTEKDDSFVEEPAIVSDRNGNAWVVWLGRKKSGKDAVVVNEYKSGWAEAVEISTNDGYYDTPRIACGKKGKPMAVWVSNVGESWFIESSVYEGGGFAKAVRITGETDGRAANPCLIATGEGGFRLAWEVYKSGKFHICFKEYIDGKWSQRVELTDSSNNTYDPAMAVDSAGKSWIAYSKAENGEKNIYLRSYDPKRSKLGKEIAVCIAEARTYQCSMPSVFCDSKDRVWIAWQRCNDKKKKDCYFGMSECFAVCYDKGKIQAVNAGKLTGDGGKVFTGSNNQLPEFLTDSDGRLWLFSMEFIGVDVNKMEVGGLLNRRAWKIVASTLDGQRGWTPAVDVLGDVRYGRLGKTAIALAGVGELWVAWQGDNILEPGEKLIAPRYSDLYMAKVKFSAPKENSGKVSFEPYSCGRHGDKVLGRRWVQRRKVTRNGETYTLLYGNLHEHTNLSRCYGDGSDGTLDDNYRYGFDVEGYDFAAATDHGYDLHEVNWRKTRRAARFYNDNPHFVGLAAYEWTLSTGDPNLAIVPGSGHRNVIFAKDEEAAKFINPKTDNIYESRETEESNMPDKLWKLLREKNIKAVTIPHHTADANHPMDWNYHDPKYQCVVEIFQTRQSCEHAGCPRQTPNLTKEKGCFVQDAMTRGYKMGFIASGDHGGMGEGVAAVLVKEISPEGITDALLARRCYATTGDKIFIDFSVNGRIMGEEIKTDNKPRITAVIDGTDYLTSVVIFRDGKIIHERNADQLKGKKNHDVDFADEDFSDNSYYYLRVVQKNNEIGWSSPIWVTKS